MLQPLVRRTWAPRGQTPILRPSAEGRSRHDRLSVISPSSEGLPLPPIDAGLDFTGAFNEKISVPMMWSPSCAPSPEISLAGYCSSWIDGVSIGQKHCGNTWKPTPRPSVLNGCLLLLKDAPDLNPVEQVWNHSKYADLVNLAPEDIEQLDHLVGASISNTRKQTHLLRSFFQTAGLAL